MPVGCDFFACLKAGDAASAPQISRTGHQFELLIHDDARVPTAAPRILSVILGER